MEEKFWAKFDSSYLVQVYYLLQFPLLGWTKFFKKFFLIFFIIALGISLFHYLSFKEIGYFGFALIFLAIFLFFEWLDLFIETSLKKPKGKAIWDVLDFDLVKALIKAKDKAKAMGLRVPNSSIILWAILEENTKLINFVFARLICSKKDLISQLKEDKNPDDFQIEELFIEAQKIAISKQKEKIEDGDLLSVLAFKNKIFKNYLIENNLRPEDVKEVVNWFDYLKQEFLESKKFWEWKNLLKKGAIGRELTAGFTVLLDAFSTDITKSMKRQKFRKIFAHQKEVELMEKYLLAPEKNNVLIVGEAGSGRRSMLESLARRCAIGENAPELNFKRVVMLDLPRLVAASGSLEAFEMSLDRIFQEAISAGNVILVVDNFHQFVGGGQKREAGGVDITPILMRYLPHPSFQFIAITTFGGLHVAIEQKPTLGEEFQKIEVSEVTPEETIWILEDRALRLEKKYKVFCTFQAIRDIVYFSQKYLPATPFPEKAIDLLDEIFVFVFGSKEKIILPQHVAKYVSQKIKIPVGELEEKEKEKLLNLEDIIHQRIVNQQEAVKEIANALRRARAGVAVRKGPMGAFLFLGPTGVGKTEVAKALSQIYFGSEERMIRLDMSEFQNLSDIPRLLGGPGEEGLLTTQVRERPFSLLLLDEFEKAHPNILNLFLQVLDEGHLTDGLGRKVDFRHTIIIATSNAGYQLIFEATKLQKEWSAIKEEIINYVVRQGIYRPELLNRFDAVVIFKPLSKPDLIKIAQLQLKKLQNALKEKEIEFVFSEELLERIVELSFNPQFGAREMQRVIQDKIANSLAVALLSNLIKRGNLVTIDPQTFQVVKLK
ncbi:ATP-dependent Clp protease ATP-binding subunit [Candidatus Parcubacteria bacterium]|nr:ATP-dependent Clp protease ATP-binding subunit [Candidatus Parcubacteria bacterium]